MSLCIASILGQTNPDFDLAVLENYSTDGTAEWLAGLHDPRIRIFPSTKELMIQENWGRILDVPKNEFMTIIGHDDILAPDYLQTMAELISAHPDAALYQTHFRIIDAQSRIIRHCLPMPERTSVADFIAARLTLQGDSFGTGYMMRSEMYHRVGGIPPYDRLFFADDALWIALMKDSWKATSPKECFSYRMHAGNTSLSSDIGSLLSALKSYVLLIKDLAGTDAEIADVLERSLDEFLIRHHKSAYISAIIVACKKDRRIMPSVKEHVLESMLALIPAYIMEFQSSKKIRILEIVNRAPFRKSAARLLQSYLSFRQKSIAA